MKMVKILTLGFCLLLASGVQAGYLTPGLESQLSDLQDDDVIKVLVVMSEQPDVKSLDWDLHDAKASMANRHSTVVGVLQDAARNSQGDLLATLENNKATGGVLGYTSHWIVNSIVVKATVAKVRELAARPDVERVEPDLVVELIEPIQSLKEVPADKGTRGIGMTPGVQAVGAPRVWNELGIDGTGVVVGILDTGVDGNHVALSSRWRGNYAPAEECWLDAAGLGDPDFPADRHYHGTHVMGTITGLAPDDTIGVAPGALWIATNVINMSTGSAFDNAVIASLEFMADPDGDPSTTIDLPAVVQNSWGVNENFTGYYDCDSRWWDAIDNCEASGVVLTWSAGNEGPGSGTLRSPGDRALSPTNCFSVGSTQPTAPYEISSFSSRGPSGCGGAFAMKPEISAPGSDIYSAQPGGGYQYLSGTSMAGPHIAGVVALMRASNPDVDVITIKEVLMATAIDLGSPGEDNTYGHGFVDAYQAVLAVMGGIGTIEGYITDSVTGYPVEGAVVSKIGGYNTDTTDANGYYSMTMPAGYAEFTVTRFGYAEGMIQATIPEDGNVNGDLAIVALPSSTVSGIVYGPDGSIVIGATVRAEDTPVDPAVTDDAGFYSLTLPSGAGEYYDLRARANGMGNQVQTIELVGDLIVDFNLPEWIGDDFESGNFNAWPWEMSGSDDWVIDGSETYEGAFSARSGNITHNQDSILSVNLDVTADGELKFWYKVSSEATYDYLRFYLDGVQKAEWAGEAGWAEFVQPVTAGNHTFTWAYEKDGSVDSGSDAGWIDFIEFPAVILPGTPSITVDAAGFDVAISPGESTVQSFNLGNIGDGVLDYSLTLYEVDPARVPMVNPVPVGHYAKDEKDERVGESPVTGAGGPDVFGYTWTDSDEPGGPVYQWVEINGVGTDMGGGDDSSLGPFNLGFTFDHYGVPFTSIRVCTNGWLSFTSTDTDYTNQGIPLSDEPNNLLAPFWDDMDVVSGGTIYYYADTANQRFIVEWDNVQHYPSGNPETFQVILNADNSIVFQYKTVDIDDSCTVGIENGDGTDGLQVVFNAPYLHDELAIRLATAPPLTWVTVDPVSGSLAPAGSQPIDLTFDTTDLAVGTYMAELLIASNDLDNSTIALPVTMTVSDVSAIGDDGLPKVVQFTGAVPNPFNPATDIKFSLPRQADVSLRLYDVSGRLVRSLLGETMTAGAHEVRWNGRDDSGRSVASGTYFARLVVAGEASTRSLVLVR